MEAQAVEETLELLQLFFQALPDVLQYLPLIELVQTVSSHIKPIDLPNYFLIDIAIVFLS